MNSVQAYAKTWLFALCAFAAIALGVIRSPAQTAPRCEADKAHFAVGETHSWREIWIIPAVIAAVVLVLFLLLFKDRSTTATANPAGVSSSLAGPTPLARSGVTPWRARGSARWRSARWSRRRG